MCAPFPIPAASGSYPLREDRDPLWARNGKQLFYRWQRSGVGGGCADGYGLHAGKPRLLFEQPGYSTWGTLRCWDISRDGQRFLMVKLDERKSQPVTELILVQNWFEELKRLVPTGGN